MNADVVIIGAGISGLVDAILLAETGRTVVVLERHNIPGGYLQQFRRRDKIFDVGFHYVGSTEPGRPMRQFLEHLQIWDRIETIPFPEDAAIEVVSGEKRFAYPTRLERFEEKALQAWPHEAKAIRQFMGDVKDICSWFGWFDLKAQGSYRELRELRLPTLSVKEYLDTHMQDPWLKEVLSLQSGNLGLYADEAPWVKYALAFRSNFDLTSRINGGGGALVNALVERGKELGVEYRFRSEVASFECEGRQVRSVTTGRDERFAGDLFVAACNPKSIARRIPEESLTPIFREHLLKMKNSRGAFQVFFSLRKPLSSIGSTCYLISDEKEASGDPPMGMVLVTYPSAAETECGGGLRLEAMTYMDYDPVAEWADRRVFKRGPEYERFKQSQVERMISIAQTVVPELPDAIEEIYSATPLTDEWYTLNEGGGVMGVSHDISQQGRDRPQTRVRLKNLYFTGHSIVMPGICGVFINSFRTTAMIRGDDELFRAVVH